MWNFKSAYCFSHYLKRSNPAPASNVAKVSPVWGSTTSNVSSPASLGVELSSSPVRKLVRGVADSARQPRHADACSRLCSSEQVRSIFDFLTTKVPCGSARSLHSACHRAPRYETARAQPDASKKEQRRLAV